MRKIIFSDEKVKEIIEKYQTNRNVAELARLYNISASYMHKLLRKNNIVVVKDYKPERKYTLNEHYFDTIDTEEKAYFLGFLYSDGYHYDERGIISLTLQESDKEILERLKLLIDWNGPLHFLPKRGNSPNSSDQYRLSFSSRILSDRLNFLGCMRAKSLIIKFPTEEQVPKYLWRHFLRGYFDGNGTIFLNKKENVIRAGICSTIYFCEEAAKFIKESIGVHYNIILAASAMKNNTTTRDLRIGGNVQVLKFLNWLYKDSTIWLNRKYDKAVYFVNNIRGKYKVRCDKEWTLT